MQSVLWPCSQLLENWSLYVLFGAERSYLLLLYTLLCVVELTMFQSWLKLLRNVGSVRHFDTVRYPENSTTNFIIICVKKILSCCSVFSYGIKTVYNTMYLTSAKISYYCDVSLFLWLYFICLVLFVLHVYVSFYLLIHLFQNISILICIFLCF